MNLLFLCPHSAAKSVMAASLVNQHATAGGVELAARFAGFDPDAAVWPSVVALLDAHDLPLPAREPRRVTLDDIAWSDRVISLGCEPVDLDGLDVGSHATSLEVWDDVPLASENIERCFAAIATRVDRLIEGIEIAESD